MILSVLNGRRMKAEEVAKLRDGSLVTIRCDPRVKPRKFGMIMQTDPLLGVKVCK